MAEIVFEYPNGTVRECTYEELSMYVKGAKKWNRAALIKYAEPVRPEASCCCRSDGEKIRMHIVERPVGSRRYYLATNPKSADRHSPKCPKHALDSPTKSVQAISTTSAVQFHTNAAGEMVVDVAISLFAGGIREKDGDDLDPTVSNVKQTPPTKYTESEDALESRTRREKAQFGGLIREWYLIGREVAMSERAEGQAHLNRYNVVYGMWKTLWDDKGRMQANGRNLSHVAYVPHSSMTRHRDGDKKVIVGLFQKVDLNESGEKQVHIRGINAVWTVSVPPDLARYVSVATKKSLIGVRARRRGGEWRMTHPPFTALLADPDAMWVESGLEEEAYGILSRTAFVVDKPLRVMNELDGLRPDFVLRGLDKLVIVEVYGREGDPTYDEHKKHKQMLYHTFENNGLLYYLEWDLSLPEGRAEFVRRLRELESMLLKSRSPS